jgi:hypothetical protein
MLPIVAVIAGKTVFDIVTGFFIAGGAVSAIKIAHDKGEEVGYCRGLEYRTQELVHLRRLVKEFQMTREALKDRLYAMVSPFKHIDICDSRFFSKSLAVLERYLPNWRDQMRKAG